MKIKVRIEAVLAAVLLLPLVALAQPATQTTPQAPQRPKTEGSMVGYIENAVVGNQVRIRFDAAFDNDFPDRAEFFYAKCGCYKFLNGIIPAAYDPNAPGPGPAVPTTLNFQQLYANVEYAPHSRVSFFAEIPVRWIQPQGFKAIPPFAQWSNKSGISDIRLGAKLAMVADDDNHLTFQFKGYVPSGDPAKGMGTNHGSVEPALLYYRKLSDRAALESEFGSFDPIGGSAGIPTAGSDRFSGHVLFYGVGPSYELYSGPRVRFAPVVELVGWHILGGFQTQPGGPEFGAGANVSGTNVVNIKIGARIGVGDRSSLYVGYGRGLTDSVWYKDLLRVEYRYSF